MATTEPTIYDHTPVDTDRQCQMHRGERPRRCTNTAEYVFVYEANSDPDDDRRRNTLACEDCVPARTD